MNLKAIGTKLTAPVSAGFSKVKFTAVKYSPEICLVLGIGTGIATVVSACKATLKADDILNQLEEEKGRIEIATKEAEEKGKDYTEKDKNKDMSIAYAHAAAGFIKLYGSTIVLGAISGGLIVCSYGIMRKRNLGLIAAYKALDNGFKRYRARTVEKFGEDVDRELASGVTKKKVMVKDADPETGEVKAEKQEVSTIDEAMLEDPSNYDRIFARGIASACTSYDPNTNESFLEGMEAYFTHLLQTRGYVFLNEVYRKLGYPDTSSGQIVGWILDYADPNYRSKRVSFGNKARVYCDGGDYVHSTGRIEPSYVESGYYLTFNVDGVIWNLINLGRKGA